MIRSRNYHSLYPVHALIFTSADTVSLDDIRSALSALACLALLATACGPADPGIPVNGAPLVFETGLVRIETPRDTVTVTVELAESQAQQIHGLMERHTLLADRGMLFVYDEPQDPDRSFFMFRTRIPLDIAFVETDGRIGNIRTMAPCPSPNPAVCRRYEAEVPFVMALEVNAGFFERHGIGVGERLVRVR